MAGTATGTYGWTSTASGVEAIPAVLILADADAATLTLADIGATIMMSDDDLATLTLTDVGAALTLEDIP